MGTAQSRPFVMVALCLVLHICFGTVYAWSFFQSLLVRQLGWSYTDSAWAFSVAIFSLGVSAAWAGAMLPRFGPRRLAVIGGVMFAGGYLVASLALHLESLALFYLGYGVIGGAGIGLGYVTPVATVAKWFPHHKGLATGIVVMGFGVGALLLSKGLAPTLLALSGGDLTMTFLWLGIVFGCMVIPAGFGLGDPPATATAPNPAGAALAVDEGDSVMDCLRSPAFIVTWIVFFFNIAAGISVISFQSSLLQDVWSFADPTVEPETLAAYGAMLIAVSSMFNGGGRLLWGMVADRVGRARVFRILLASQMVVFGVLMTERDPIVFSALVCYVLLCFGGGFAVMPSFIADVFGTKRMSSVYGAILTAWAAAGLIGPLYVGYLKDVYPDRAVMYCFLIGILMLGLGWVFTYLLNDDPVRLKRPTLASTLRELGILKA
ncbi:MAG: OFA family MFS transporter [Gammaproteobacteria bacterium]|nr:OFA family MFS transporter [Gammaproteobacteria bacterium]MDE0273623.1 OFA family MFS transporter [Gammaproteobacteria bacterium]